jgi:hypothetical protein
MKFYANLEYLPDLLLMIIIIANDWVKPLYDGILYNLSMLFSVANYATVTEDEMNNWSALWKTKKSREND